MGFKDGLYISPFEEAPQWLDTAAPTNMDIDMDVSADGGFMSSIGGLKGLGTIASVLGALHGASEERKFKKEVLKREDDRIARDRGRQERFENGIRKAYGITS